MKKKIRNINKKYLLRIKKILERKRRSILDDYLTPEEKKLLGKLKMKSNNSNKNKTN